MVVLRLRDAGVHPHAASITPTHMFPDYWKAIRGEELKGWCGLLAFGSVAMSYRQTTLAFSVSNLHPGRRCRRLARDDPERTNVESDFSDFSMFEPPRAGIRCSDVEELAPVPLALGGKRPWRREINSARGQVGSVVSKNKTAVEMIPLS